MPAVRVDAAGVVAVERALTRWRRKLASARGGAFAPRAAAETTLLRRTRRRLDRLVRKLTALLPPDRQTLHAARIAAKRVRYALELLEPLDPELRPLLRLLRAFQDSAGDAHDLAELAAKVRDVAATRPESALALGPLARALETEATQAVARARSQGAALAGPAGRLRKSLGAPE